MDADAEMHARHAALLGELAELGMTLARDLHARALAAETAEEAENLASGFHKLSRSVRQSLALEARLRRDAARAEREVAEQARTEAAEPTVRRRAEAKARLDRLIWTEAEDELTAAFWQEGADRLLAEAEFTQDFATGDLDRIVETLARTLRDQPPRETGPAKPRLAAVEWRIIDVPPRDPSPPAGEDGPGSGSDEGSRSALRKPDTAPTDPPDDPSSVCVGLPGELPPWETG